MKKFHRILAAVMAVFSLSLLIPTITPAQAATTEKVYVNYTYFYNEKTGNYEYKDGPKNLIVSTFSKTTFDVYSQGGASKIKNLKVNKKGLTAKVLSTYGSTYKDTPENSYRRSQIGLYAKKPGTYSLSFKVGSKSYKMTIKALTYTGEFKKITYGSSVLSDRSITESDDGYTSTYTYRSKVSESSGKFSVTANKEAGYKVTGLVVVTADKKGKPSYKKVKNGAKITLSKGKLTYTSDYSTYVKAKKYTYIYVSYKNTLTGESVAYSVGKNPDTKKPAVKCVRKYANGNTYTSYFENGDGYDCSIWK